MDNSGWTPAPRVLAVEMGWVHVFRLRLDLPQDRLDSLHALLSPDEVARANRYRAPRDQTRFTAARGQLREILSGYAKTRPEQLVFQVAERGRPALADPYAPDFNLSHSGSLALLAVATRATDVGVDIEAVRPELDFERMARRFFAPAEVETLLALPQGQRMAAFFHCWTRKEAYMKARGLGLTIPLDGFEVSLTPGEPPRLLRPAAGDPHGGEWVLWQIDPGQSYTAALCARRAVTGIRCWDGPD